MKIPLKLKVCLVIDFFFLVKIMAWPISFNYKETLKDKAVLSARKIIKYLKSPE